MEVLVVDNASTDGSVARVRERFPWVRLIENESNRGFAAANNQAFPHCRGRYVLLLNADTEVEPGALAAMIDCLERSGEIGALGPRLLNSDGSFQRSGYSFPSLPGAAARMFLRSAVPGARCPVPGPKGGPSSCPSRAPGTGHRAPTTLERHDWLTGACLMVRREVLERVGALDEGYFFECEDVDWCRRIRAAGWEIGLLPMARVLHHGGASGIGYSLNALRGHEGHCYYFRKHHGRAAEWGMRGLFSAYHLLGWMKYSLRFRLWRNPGDRQKREVHRRGCWLLVVGCWLGRRGGFPSQSQLRTNNQQPTTSPGEAAR